MSNAQRKGHGVSVRHGISSGSYKYIIKKLEQQLQESQQLYTGLADLNASLRAKEAVLLENVSSQSNNLHYVGLALFQEPLLSAQGDNTGSIAQTLLQDVKVAELLELLGGPPTPDEPYTSQCMRRAFTPDRVQKVRNMSVKQVVDQLRQLTMKLAMVLQAAPDAGEHDAEEDGSHSLGTSLLSYTVDDIVDEYTELAMLLHVVSDKANLELGVLNLDTMQQQEPPLGHWKMVLKKLHLKPDQIKHIYAGFEIYTSKTTPLVTDTHKLVDRMQILAAGSTTSSSSSRQQHASSSSSSQATEAPRNLNLYSKPPSAAAAAAAAAAAMASRSSSGLSDTAVDSSHGHAISSLSINPPTSNGSSQQQPAVVAGSDRNKAVIDAAAASLANWSLGNGGAMLDCDQMPDFNSDNNCVQPWQQFGLPSGGLTPEDSQQLEQMLEQLLQNVMRLREIHRTMTFLWLNTLDKRQLAVSIVKSYPYWSQPITMCKHLMEEEQQRQQQQQKSPGASATLLSKTHTGSAKASG